MTDIIHFIKKKRANRNTMYIYHLFNHILMSTINPSREYIKICNDYTFIRIIIYPLCNINTYIYYIFYKIYYKNIFILAVGKIEH